MSGNEYFCFEKKLAYHTAPTLLGIKCASLLSLSMDEFDISYHVDLFNRKSASKGIYLKILCECKNRVLVLLYHKTLLMKRLEDPEIRKFLEQYGYSKNIDMSECLKKLSHRIMEKSQFPHEIGIFLGYPLDDVIGFIENRGENCKMSGYWKVYSNIEQANKTFINYKKCRNFLCSKLNNGLDIYQVLKIS